MHVSARQDRGGRSELDDLRASAPPTPPAAPERCTVVVPRRLRPKLDLMVRLAGLRLRERCQDWDRGPFTGESQDHISVYEVTAAPAG